MGLSSRLSPFRLTVLALSTAGLFAAGARAQVLRTGPSAFCHVTDGAFTHCAAPPGEEWSDIDFLVFGGANVYTDQSLVPANLHLMYDLIGRNVPLGPAESFDVRFDVVEDGQLEHYLVQVFGNGATAVFVDGVPAPSGEGIAGAVGFGPSPVHPGFFDVFVELAVPMNVVYSPDIPLFWSTSAPPRDCQQGPAGCCKPGDPGCNTRPAPVAPQTVSATIVSANSDGTTTVVKVPLDPQPADFCVAGRGVLIDLMAALVPPGASRNHGAEVSRVVEKTRQALDSLVNSQVLTRAEAGRIEACVIAARASGGAGG